MLSDVTAIVIAFIAAFALRASSPVAVANPMPFIDYLAIMVTVLPFWMLIFALLRLYDHNIYERRFSEIGRLFMGSFIALLLLVGWDYMSNTVIFPAKLVPVYGLGIAFVLLVVFRNILRAVRVALFNFGYGLTHVVLIGNTPITAELVTTLRNSKKSGYRLAGVVGYRKALPGRRVKTYPNFASFMRGHSGELHGIIQTQLYTNETRNAEILTYAQEHHIGYQFVPGNTELFVGDIEVDLFRNSIPVIHVRQTPLFGWGRIIKRLTDIILGSLLLVIALPLILLVFLLEKMTDRSAPAFYKAKRYSRYGSMVYVYKFRSMRQKYNGMTPEEAFASMGRPGLIKKYRANGDQLKNDPRVSRLGKILRATSLDELPQIWNVVHGEISLVGPRALDVFELENYAKKNLILAVKSGLTGLAVVSGRHNMSFEERRKLDLYYVQNWSMWLDMTILFKTFRVVFERLIHRGARYRD